MVLNWVIWNQNLHPNFLFFFHTVIGLFGIYRMKVRKTVDNPDSQFVAMPQTITPAGIELNPTTEPIEEPEKKLD